MVFVRHDQIPAGYQTDSGTEHITLHGNDTVSTPAANRHTIHIPILMGHSGHVISMLRKVPETPLKSPPELLFPTPALRSESVSESGWDSVSESGWDSVSES